MRLDDKLYARLEQDIRERLAVSEIKRGWKDYTEGHADRVKEIASSTITGIVNGVELHAVVLDADHFRYSTCTCLHDGFCNHMAAVFFKYIAQNEGDEAARLSYFRLLGLSPASALVGNEGNRSHADLQEDSRAYPVLWDDVPFGHSPMEPSIHGWMQVMDDEYGQSWQKCRHSLHALQPVLSALKGKSKDWPKPLQRLHWITAILFVLDQAERAILTVDSFSRYYHEMSFIRMAEPWLERAFELLAEFDLPEASEQERAVLSELIGYVRGRALREEKQLFDWVNIYMAFCEKMSGQAEWQDREKAHLESLLESEETEQSAKALLHAALGMMCFFVKADEEAIAQFRSSSFERYQRLIYPCVGTRINEEEWESVRQWMRYLFDCLKAVRSARNIGPFMTLCRYGDAARPDLPEWNEYMLELLPYSYAELSEHWFEMKRIKEWADLQMLMGVKPEDHNAATLRDAAKASPESLIPLYHHSIEAAIQLRNRQSYRLAVKQLKKLEKLYKAVKETERWERYLNGLATKHQRLRALQEELWRGKLLQ